MKCKLIILLLISVILAGCVEKFTGSNLPQNDTTIIITKYIENSGPIITKDDFPGFELIDHSYSIARDNLTLTIETEGFHGTYIINASDQIPEGYRIYGGRERYNLSKRYLLMQYKVFDKDDKLNDSMNLTIDNYVKEGFRPVFLNNTRQEVQKFILESNATNLTGMNITLILFKYGTVLGTIGVQDSTDKSLNESMKILNIAVERIKINSKEMKINKTSIIAEMSNTSEQKDMEKNSSI